MKKTNMNRREFNTLATSLGLLTFGAPLESILANENVSEEGIKGKKLIVLSLHGGCDTLNAFIPSGIDEYKVYKSLRPRIAIEKNTLELSIDGGEINQTFRLNPHLEGLSKIYNKGQLAFFPATHCLTKEQIKKGIKANRSHFHQQDLFDRGGTTEDTKSNEKLDHSGWLAKYLNPFNSKEKSKGIRGFDFYGKGRVFEGHNIPVLALEDPSRINIGKDILEKIKEINMQSKIRYQRKTDHGEVSHRYAQMQKKLYKRIVKIQGIAGLDEVYPTNKYPLAKQLKQTATLLREIKELEVVQLVMGGWDTHANQLRTQAGLFEELDKSLKAFYDDLTDKELDNVVIVVQTEFGRTLKVNGTNGTDHGQASGWFVIGGNVKGGQKGKWLSLTDKAYENERYIKQQTDYRDILGTILKRHMGMRNSQIRKIFDSYRYIDDFIG